MVAIALMDMNIKGPSGPFDWTLTNSRIILDYFKNGDKNFLDFNHDNIKKDFLLHKRYPPNYEKNFQRPNLKFTPSKFINKY